MKLISNIILRRKIMNNEIILLKGAATSNCKGFRNIIKDFKNAGTIKKLLKNITPYFYLKNYIKIWRNMDFILNHLSFV